jgi:hypothetical protein
MYSYFSTAPSTYLKEAMICTNVIRISCIQTYFTRCYITHFVLNSNNSGNDSDKFRLNSSVRSLTKIFFPVICNTCYVIMTAGRYIGRLQFYSKVNIHMIVF